MFDLEATCRKLGIWDEELSESKDKPDAIRAIHAIQGGNHHPPGGKLHSTESDNSPNSNNSPYPAAKSDNSKDYKTELEAAKKLFAPDAPFTDEEIANREISKLKLRGDRDFVSRVLKSVHGKKRLEIVEQYFTERQAGMDAEPVEQKKENAGRFRANTWLLNRETKPH
jgi:hypothetical protein